MADNAASAATALAAQMPATTAAPSVDVDGESQDAQRLERKLFIALVGGVLLKTPRARTRAQGKA